MTGAVQVASAGQVARAAVPVATAVLAEPVETAGTPECFLAEPAATAATVVGAVLIQEMAAPADRAVTAATRGTVPQELEATAASVVMRDALVTAAMAERAVTAARAAQVKVAGAAMAAMALMAVT